MSEDRLEIERVFNKFLPYSNFSFSNLWSWDTENRISLSFLHGNLIVKFWDTKKQIPVLSFLGDNSINETAAVLLSHSKEYQCQQDLGFLPEQIAIKLDNSKFLVTPDASCHDYIISTRYLSDLNILPNKKHSRAGFCKRFLLTYPVITSRVFTPSLKTNEECTAVFKKWAAGKKLNHLDLEEFKAFKRYLDLNCASTVIVSLYDGDVMIAFQILELVSASYALAHFIKADTAYRDVFAGLMWHLGCYLQSKGVPYLNIEEDMGNAGLREDKLQYKPDHFLKKYIVSNGK